MSKTYKCEIITAVHETTASLHEAGVMDKQTIGYVLNDLQATILQEFRCYFAKDTVVLYLAGSAIDPVKLAQLYIPAAAYRQLPSIVLYDEKRQWLYLIEDTTTHRHFSSVRVSTLDELLHDCPADLIFVTAVPDMKTYIDCSADIAADTMVWVADRPSHSIHYDNEGVLRPR